MHYRETRTGYPRKPHEPSSNIKGNPTVHPLCCFDEELERASACVPSGGKTIRRMTTWFQTNAHTSATVPCIRNIGTKNITESNNPKNLKGTIEICTSAETMALQSALDGRLGEAARTCTRCDVPTSHPGRSIYHLWAKRSEAAISKLPPNDLVFMTAILPLRSIVRPPRWHKEGYCPPPRAPGTVEYPVDP